MGRFVPGAGGGAGRRASTQLSLGGGAGGGGASAIGAVALHAGSASATRKAAGCSLRSAASAVLQDAGMASTGAAPESCSWRSPQESCEVPTCASPAPITLAAGAACPCRQAVVAERSAVPSGIRTRSSSATIVVIPAGIHVKRRSRRTARPSGRRFASVRSSACATWSVQMFIGIGAESHPPYEARATPPASGHGSGHLPCRPGWPHHSPRRLECQLQASHTA